MMKLCDKYSLNARIYPSIVFLLPCIMLAIFYVPNIESYYQKFSYLGLLGVLFVLLAHWGRENGKKKESELFRHWGGKPTSLVLRHSNDYFMAHIKKIFHKKLEQKIPSVKIPTAEEECVDLRAADEIYDSCARYLISKTRNTKKYRLLFDENINYGFRRNLWGLKRYGICITVVCIFTHIFILMHKYSSDEAIIIKDLIFLAALVVCVICWISIVNKEWVKTTAFAYAERLYETLHE